MKHKPLPLFQYKLLLAFLGSIASLCICYICGTIQFAFVGSVGFYKAFSACVLPFLPLDVVKCFAGVMLGMKIRKKLSKELT